MCYFLALLCLAVSFTLAEKGMSIFIAFLIASVCFGFFGMVFEVSNHNSKNKWEAMVKTYTDMSPDQLKEVTKV